MFPLVRGNGWVVHRYQNVGGQENAKFVKGLDLVALLVVVRLYNDDEASVDNCQDDMGLDLEHVELAQVNDYQSKENSTEHVDQVEDCLLGGSGREIVEEEAVLFSELWGLEFLFVPVDQTS